MTNIKVITKIGKEPGNKTVILAGVHGNESYGVRMLEKLIPKLKITKGKVTFIYANLEAIKQNKRFVEYNLNRCFLKDQPEEMKISLEGKTAKEIMPFLEEADVTLDLHASGTPNSTPFIICQPQTFEFAKILPAKIVSYNWDLFEPGSTDHYMNLQKKAGLCIECGYLGDLSCEIIGKDATLSFLKKTGNIDGTPKIISNQKFLKVTSLYKNMFGPFKTKRKFEDFEELKENEIIGYDWKKKILARKDEIILFARDRKLRGEECFLTLKETLLNKNNLK